jgi:hypothetical protein
MLHEPRRRRSWLIFDVSPKYPLRMESFLEALLEVVLQIFGDAIVDGLLRSRNPVVRAFTNAIIAAFFGALFAFLSLWIYPHHVIRSYSLRLAALALMPLANGFLMQIVGGYFEKRGQLRSGFEHVMPAAVFSFVFGVVRFQLAK